MADVLSALYPWTKTLHIVSMVAWMAGLFYLPRIFVYHVERGGEAGMDATFGIMELKLYRFIMGPASVATWGFGLVLALTPGVVDWTGDGWFHVKLAVVIGLTWFHYWLGARRRDFAAGRNRLTGRQWRLMNEVPTLALLVIVTMVVVKPF